MFLWLVGGSGCFGTGFFWRRYRNQRVPGIFPAHPQRIRPQFSCHVPGHRPGLGHQRRSRPGRRLAGRPLRNSASGTHWWTAHRRWVGTPVFLHQLLALAVVLFWHSIHWTSHGDNPHPDDLGKPVVCPAQSPGHFYPEYLLCIWRGSLGASAGFWQRSTRLANHPVVHGYL